MGLLFYLVAIWGVLYLYHRFLSPRRQRLRRRLRMLASMIKDRTQWDRDILKQNDREQLEAWHQRYLALDKKASPDELNSMIDEGHIAISRPYPRLPSWAQYTKETIELIVVVFGVVAGLRALFLQPFKIPTGSMQPTLYGIHFIEDENVQIPALPKRALDYVNYSRRYVDETAHADGTIDISDLRTRTELILFPTTSFRHAGHDYTFPGAPVNVLQYLPWQRGNRMMEVQQGQTLASGYLMLGDHLFVDRVSYNYREPRRGDVVVFITDGLRTVDRQPLNGRYFIKRLVGLPGDSLKIVDGKMLVKEPGAADFTVMDGSYHQAFDRMYSGMGGYRGYTHGRVERGAQFLLNNHDARTLTADQYFLLGDNSENSQDSRYWGIVPRENIVGRAFFVWWPFTRRWGWVDRAEPEAYPTPHDEL